MIERNFSPSQIEDAIYKIMEDYETEGVDLYNEGVILAIMDFFVEHDYIDFKLACSPWPDRTGGVCAICFTDQGNVHMIIFDYKKNME